MVHHFFLKNPGKEAKIGHWPVILHAILIEGEFFQKGETWADLKCEEKEPSVSDKLIIDVKPEGTGNQSVGFASRLCRLGHHHNVNKK